MPWSWPLRILRWLLLLLALAGVVVTAIPGILGSMTWWVRYLDYPRLEILIGMMIVWMVLALLPVIGLPLPLVSYGGSSLLPELVSLGLLISFARNEPGARAALRARRRSKSAAGVTAGGGLARRGR